MSELCRELVDQLAVALHIDFRRQDFLGAGKGQRGYLAAKLFAGPVQFLVDFRLGRLFQAIAFLASLILGLLDNLVGATVGGICVISSC